MLKLYEHPLSPYAQKVKLALYAKNVPFESEIPNVFAPEGGFDDASLRREVPALVDGGLHVFDSTIIVEYIEDKWPDPALLPESPEARARARMIEEVCDTYYEAINWALAEIRYFKRATGELAERLTRRAGEQTAGVHAWLERQLGKRRFFAGEAVGWADFAVWPHVAASAGFGFGPPEGSALGRWLAEVSAQADFRKCAEAAAGSLAGFDMVASLVESGQFQRQYRDHRLEWMIRSGGLDIVLAGLEKKNIRFSREVS